MEICSASLTLLPLPPPSQFNQTHFGQFIPNFFFFFFFNIPHHFSPVLFLIAVLPENRKSGNKSGLFLLPPSPPSLSARLGVFLRCKSPSAGRIFYFFLPSWRCNNKLSFDSAPSLLPPCRPLLRRQMKDPCDS